MTRLDAHRSFTHEAWLYAEPDEFVRSVAAFVEEGVDAHEPVLVAVEGVKIERLRDALGHTAGAVAFVDMTEIGRNPARIIPAWRDFVNAHADAPALRGVGEPFFPGRNAAARDECHAHEALLNVGLADAPIRLVCPYDVERLTPADIERVLANHPIVEVDGHRRSNPRVATVEWLGMPLPEPPTGLVEFDFGITSLFQLRRVVEERTRALAFTDARREEIVLVASEIATNSLRHGGGRGLFRCWSEGATFVCEALDSGWIREPMIGRVRPRPGQAGGHGVWLANQLADLVQIRSAEGRTVVRMFFTA